MIFSIHMLSIITTLVQANRSGVYRYIFAYYRSVQMALVGWLRTSAAIPLFHARPMADMHPARKPGKAEGT